MLLSYKTHNGAYVFCMYTILGAMALCLPRYFTIVAHLSLCCLNKTLHKTCLKTVDLFEKTWITIEKQEVYLTPVRCVSPPPGQRGAAGGGGDPPPTRQRPLGAEAQRAQRPLLLLGG